MIDNNMVGWHHWLNGHEFKQCLEVVKDREACSVAVHELAFRLDRVTEQQH